MAFLKAIKCFKSRAKVLPETMYRVHLESEGPYGLMLCGHETIQCLVIVSIQKSKAVKAWNSDHPHCRIEEGHSLMEVNGHTEPKQMLDELRRAKAVDLLVSAEPNAQQLSVFRAARALKLKSDAVDTFLEEVTSCDVEPCSICHEEMCCHNTHTAQHAAQHAAAVVRLPCGHHFHQKCVKKWLVGGRGDPRCPLCNRIFEVAC
ncbi:unnamed protein product [Durusdinium trenchii]|uniref:RING-type domain-containing protein n=2 Tax=Durusdinium trenchii TaxID=1381693 RepID=A0ABP0SLU1_9DINO